jgi:hypothetical protein
MYQFRERRNVTDDYCTALPFNESHAREFVKLARHGFAVRVDAAGYCGVGRGRRNGCDAVAKVGRIDTSEAQQLGMYPAPHWKRAELNDPH